MGSDGVVVASTPEEPQPISRSVSCVRKRAGFRTEKKSLEARWVAGKKCRYTHAWMLVKPRVQMMNLARLYQEYLVICLIAN